MIALLAAAAVLVAIVGFWAASQTKKHLAEAQKQLAIAKQALEEKTRLEASIKADLSDLKIALRTEKDALKALKKKRFEDKAPAPAAPVIEKVIDEEMAAQVRELDAQWRVQSEKLEAAEKTVRQALADAEALRKRLEKAEGVTHDIDALKREASEAKARAEQAQNQVMEMRRKVEWHRRIHLMQKHELELQRDRTAQVRRRLLELMRAANLTQEQKDELDRLKREEAAYQRAAELH